MQRILAIGMFLAMVLAALRPSYATDPSRQVWFAPDEDSPDLIQLFTRPDLWASVRPKINVFKIGPVMAGAKHNGPNGLEQLAAVGAFQYLREWGISLALEAPAIKKWDCSGRITLSETLRYISATEHAGGHFKYIAMDEPLASALRDCGLTMDRAADVVASYVKALRASRPDLAVGDIVAYPHFPPAQILSWENMVSARGAKPAFIHLDTDVNNLDLDPKIDYVSDLRTLMRGAHTEGVPFGVIFWPGRDPLSSSESYYRYTVSWVRRAHAAIGAPDQAVFQSWVTRSSRTCIDSTRACRNNNPRCGPADPPDCGQKSIPINLPDNDTHVYSHTRLISDSLRMLDR